MKKIYSPVLFFFACLFFTITNAQVSISEIAWMGTPASAYDEWIEIYNAGSDAVDLNGWKIESSDQKFSVTLSGTISAPQNLANTERFFLLERTDDTSTNQSANQIYTGGLNNSGVKLLLKNAAGEIIDQTPEGAWVAGDNTNKKSMERVNFLLDGNLTSNWKSNQHPSQTVDAKNNQINGTPKFANSVTPIELFEPKPTKFLQKKFNANISQISPNTFKSQPEWFFITIESESAVDVTEWKISNGKTVKKMKDWYEKIEWIEGDFIKNLAGTTHEKIIYPADKKFLLPKWNPQKRKFVGTFFWPKSPISLSDSGGKIILLDRDDKILDQKTFPKATKTTINGQTFRESFVYENDQTTAVLQTQSQHTPQHFLTQSFLPPTPADQIEIFISEIAPTRQKEPDFIEIFIAETPANGANLKYTEIKHNGSKILFFNEDYLVNKGDFLLIYFDKSQTKLKKDNKHIFSAQTRSTISTTSGTVEINSFANTSQNKLVDFSCWYKTNLNKTESARVKKLETKHFCRQKEFLPQESWAKNSKDESFFSHLHGSAGEKNNSDQIKNFRPVPIIGKQTGSSHSINVTGEDSFDPNGDWDLKNYWWNFSFGERGKEKIFSTEHKLNPTTIYLDLHKELSAEQCKKNSYKMEFTLTDQLGLMAKNSISYPLYFDSYCRIGTPKIQTKKVIQKWNEPSVSAKNIWTKENFFSDFEKIGTKPTEPLKKIVPKKIWIRQIDKIKYEKKLTPQQIQQNISLIFQP